MVLYMMVSTFKAGNMPWPQLQGDHKNSPNGQPQNTQAVLITTTSCQLMPGEEFVCGISPPTHSVCG